MWSRVILTRERIEEVLRGEGVPKGEEFPQGEEISSGEKTSSGEEIPSGEKTLSSEVIPTAEETLTARGVPAEGFRAKGAVGARVEFQGIVRDQESDPVTGSLLPISALEYEAHEEMAVHQMERIVRDLGARLPLIGMLVVHRIGIVPVGEPSLFLRVDAPHRAEALEGCAAFIDELKRWVPIWKHAVTDAR